MTSPGPAEVLDFTTSPEEYRHWRLDIDGEVATLTLAVDPSGGIRSDYELKTNSYDLAVDIELHDAAQRLRFEHPQVKVVVVTGGLDKIFCAGANIQMLASATHEHKVNFCKFTNETRNGIEDATANPNKPGWPPSMAPPPVAGTSWRWRAIEILLVDDRSSAISLPEIPLLAVLPGTVGLPGSSRSGTCGGIWPMPLPPGQREYGDRLRSTGHWWTILRPPAPSTSWSPNRVTVRAAESDRAHRCRWHRLAPSCP